MKVHRGADDHERPEGHEGIRHGMRPLGSLLPFPEALKIAVDSVNPISRTESVSLPASSGRVAAAVIRSPMDVPRYSRAAMDGYAVRSHDTSGASPDRPVIVHRVDSIAPGRQPRRRIVQGSCAEIATGATVPAGADAVVMVEHTRARGDAIEILEPVGPGRNVSPKGEDIRRNDVVVNRGDLLSSGKVGALAAVGKVRVRVFGKPRVAILSTGDELVSVGRRLRPGQLYDVNSHTVSTVVHAHGGEASHLGHVRDRIESLRAAMGAARRADLIVFTGGSSVGKHDLVVDFLRATGTLRFHGLAVKPGRPTAFGFAGGKPVLGLPGFTTSCLTMAHVLLAPVLRKLARLPPVHPRTVEAPLAQPIEKSRGRTVFHTVRLVAGRAVSAYRESSTITSMAGADGYIEIDEDVTRLDEGAKVPVILF